MENKYTSIMFESANDGSITKGLFYSDNCNLLGKIDEVIKIYNPISVFVLWPFNCDYKKILTN